jgi:hypothetical protein
MHSLSTAIIHLRQPPAELTKARIEPSLRFAKGVNQVTFDAIDSLISVHFDHEQTGLADLVRLIEDQGAEVASVAQRRLGVRKAG